jgi:hypothetical protein
MEEPGQLVEVSELAGELKVSRQTLSNYLSYLEQSFLVRKLYNYSTGRRKVERKLKRYYPTIISVDLLFREDDLSKSRVFEWAVINQMGAEFFWRDSYKNEVDAILTNRKSTPVETKYGKIEVLKDRFPSIADGILSSILYSRVGATSSISMSGICPACLSCLSCRMKAPCWLWTASSGRVSLSDM